MSKKLIRFILPLILILCSELPGEEAGPFSPFVSRFQVFVEEGSVKLTWLDAPEAVAGYQIFRYTEEINEENFSKAVKIGEVEQGKGFFVDHPREDIGYFYAVLAVQQNGELSRLFIPFRNKSVRAVVIRRSAVTEDVAVAVKGLRAVASDNSIKLSFRSSKPGRDITVYRHTIPITTVNDVRSSQVVGVISSDKDSFIDFALPGVSYYYAVIDTQLSMTQNFTLTMGENSTAAPAEIPLSEVTGRLLNRSEIRPLPLPTLVLSKSIDTGRDLPNPLPSDAVIPLKASTEAAVRRFLSGFPSREIPDPEPQILDIDRAEAPVGESYLLFKILTNEFREKNWAEAEKLLREFLTVKREKELERRAYFYLGQACFFEGSYKDAFMAFLYSQEGYYAETQAWIDATFYHLRTNN